MSTRAGITREWHVAVVSNGEFAHPERLCAVLEAADRIIAADGAAGWLVRQGRPPHVVVGDMDSVNPAVLERLVTAGCRLVRHPTHKDETDTELALLEAVRLGATRITLLGALGGRMDHAVANIMLMLMPALAGIETAIYDGVSRLFLLRDAATVRGAAGDVLSLIPLGGDAEGVVTEGLEYPLRNETLAFGPARGVSNVFLGDTARVALRGGILLAVHTPREHLEETT